MVPQSQGAEYSPALRPPWGLVMILLGIVLLLGWTSGALADDDIMLPGDVLTADMPPIKSANKDYQLVMQSDGNLVLYNLWQAPIWASNTQGSGNYAQLDSHGTLVVSDRYGDVFRWRSTSADRTSKAASFLKVQDDGKLVIYQVRDAAVVADNCVWFPDWRPNPGFCYIR